MLLVGSSYTLSMYLCDFAGIFILYKAGYVFYYTEVTCEITCKFINHIPIFFFSSGVAAQRGLWPPHLGFLDHAQRRTKVVSTPLDE